MLNLILMGTPAFAVPALEALARAHRVSLVVTRPDQPKGRGHRLAASPVKEKALELGIPLAQPVSLKDAGFHEIIAAQKADLLVVVAFRVLPVSLFPLARLGAVNLHASLLPKYRGAAPVPWAIAGGETETGVTVFRLDEKIDHGRILAQEKTPIGPAETAGELLERLGVLGRDLLLRTLDDMEADRLVPREQDHAAATPAPKLKKEDGRIDWSLPARAICIRVRAFNPYPVCYAVDSGTERMLRIHRAAAVPGTGPGPGVLSVAAGRPKVGTGEGLLELLEVQWEGKPRIAGGEFVNGLRGAPLSFLPR